MEIAAAAYTAAHTGLNPGETVQNMGIFFDFFGGIS
jgi:hypothetical protein